MDSKVVFVDSSSKDKEIQEESIKFKLLNFLTKKNLKIIGLILIAIIGAIIFSSGFSSKKKDKNDLSVYENNAYMTTLEYCAELESKLIDVISNVSGAGQVKVMVSVDGSPELVYASDDSKTSSSNSSGTTTSSNSSSPIIVDVGSYNSALILTEKLPNVKGVIIVSSGADDVFVKLNIMNAVSTLLGISNDQVSVLKGV
jgi:stage III sporulation protein AG